MRRISRPTLHAPYTFSSERPSLGLVLIGSIMLIEALLKMRSSRVFQVATYTQAEFGIVALDLTAVGTAVSASDVPELPICDGFIVLSGAVMTKMSGCICSMCNKFNSHADLGTGSQFATLHSQAEITSPLG